MDELYAATKEDGELRDYFHGSSFMAPEFSTNRNEVLAGSKQPFESASSKAV
jgi:hypothetical protein